MREQHLRVLLEDRRDRDHWDVLRHRVEGLQAIRAHEEIDPAGEQQHAVVHLRAARHDRHVEAVFPVGAVGDRLIEAAMLGLGDPVGAERDLVELLGEGGRGESRKGGGRERAARQWHDEAPLG